MIISRAYFQHAVGCGAQTTAGRLVLLVDAISSRNASGCCRGRMGISLQEAIHGCPHDIGDGDVNLSESQTI